MATINIDKALSDIVNSKVVDVGGKKPAPAPAPLTKSVDLKRSPYDASPRVHRFQPPESTAPKAWVPPKREPYREDEVDWRVLDTIKFHRNYHFMTFVEDIGLTWPIYRDYDPVFERVSKEFLKLKQATFQK